jgi:branched-chain amino acid transport system substrate-binding protein
MKPTFTRRTVAAGISAAVAMPWVTRRAFAASKPIVIGVAATSTAAVGAADHGDHINGSTLAVDEINKSGGVLGRELKQMVIDFDPLSPESSKQAIAQCIDAQVDAISNPWMLPPLPAMDASSQYKCPYLHGSANRVSSEAVKANPEKYGHVFMATTAEKDYGWTFPLWLEHAEELGGWKPKNRNVHIVQEQIAYCQTISKCAQEAIKKRGKFEVAGITNIQYPVQDWANVVRELKEVDAGVIIIDHFVAAELAGFAKQFIANPVPNSLVYLQYGPSQPEFLTLTKAAGNGFCWSTVTGVYNDEIGQTFRAKYKKRFPGVMGLVYTGVGYDMAYILKRAWEGVGEPRKFKEVASWMRSHPVRGVCGYYDMNNPYQEPLHFPDNGFDDLQTAGIEKGQSQFYCQIQDQQHKIVYPNEISEAKLTPAPWWK